MRRPSRTDADHSARSQPPPELIRREAPLKTANIITLIRIALVPVFIAAWYFLPWYAAFTVFVVASVTDKLDGYIARHYDQVTNFGKFVDPLADKLLITSALLLFVKSGTVGTVYAILIIAREFIVTSLRVVAMSDGRVLAASVSGKIKMVVQCVVLAALLIEPVFGAAGSVGSAAVFGAVTVNDLLVILMTAVTLWSGIEYLVRNRDVINSF